MDSCLRRGFGAVALVIAVAVPRQAEAQEDLTGGLRLGWLMSGTDTARVRMDPMTYPTIGLFWDWTWFHVDSSTPALFILGDAIVGLIDFAAGGDGGPPVFQALNGENPGKTPLFEINGRVSVLQRHPHYLDLGPHIDLSLWSPYLPRGERAGLLMANVGGAVGYRFHHRQGAITATVGGGNGFGGEGAQTNPYVASSNVAHIWFGDTVVGAYGRFDFALQLANLNNADQPHLDQFRVVTWVAATHLETGLVFRIWD
ncbi:MAG: hypothetical protein KC731_05380 [Myxococcales bacterium]|nr:hypothetical protein [Myxococcales bacterium]